MTFIEVAEWSEDKIPQDLNSAAKLMDEAEFYELKHSKSSKGTHRGIMALCKNGCGEWKMIFNGINRTFLKLILV